MPKRPLAVVLVALTAVVCVTSLVAAPKKGDKVNERGLLKRKDILYFLSFDNRNRTRSRFGTRKGYGWTGRKENVRLGTGALEIQQTRGTHLPMEISPEITPVDSAYVRWYRKWEEGYDFTQHKMPGVYARSDRRHGGGAGVRPNGRDKFSCKLFINHRRQPAMYSYHPDQKGRFGDHLKQNIGEPVTVEAGKWYCFEMMIKANNAPKRDGELKMWVDGKLVAHHKNMRFRDTNKLKINKFTHSAYVGGTWTSKRDQKLWDDQIVVARNYIGPIDYKKKKEKEKADDKPRKSRFSPPPGYEDGEK